MNKKMSVEEAQELLKKYRLGICSKSELEIINRWYYSFGENEDGKLDADALNDVKEQMLAEITNRINLEEEVTKLASGRSGGDRKVRFIGFHYVRRMAAILIVGALAGAFFYSKNFPSDVERSSSAVASPDENASGNIARVTVPSTIYLADGSVVWLKDDSRLEYPRTFSAGIREVTLVGEAFFDVAKDPQRPFIIHSANLTTRVLGTTFNIKAYGEGEAQEEVVVVTGEVLVSVKGPSADNVKQVLLKPNHKAIYSTKDRSLVKADVTGAEVQIALEKSKLAFDEIPLQDIIRVVNAAHDVRISLSNESMNDCVITADLTHETMEVSMAILSKAINATYTIEGKNIIFHGDGCGVSTLK